MSSPLDGKNRTTPYDPTYKIVRHYSDDNRANRTVKRGLTLEQAQAHCQRDDTHGGDYDKGDAWFDGYTKETN